MDGNQCKVIWRRVHQIIMQTLVLKKQIKPLASLFFFGIIVLFLVTTVAKPTYLPTTLAALK